jgi:hypothetical protein
MTSRSGGHRMTLARQMLHFHLGTSGTAWVEIGIQQEPIDVIMIDHIEKPSAN